MTVLETWTVLPKTILTSQPVAVIVNEVGVRSATVPLATALLPGEGDAAPGLGHAAPKAPPPRPAPMAAWPPVREAWFWVAVFALTLLWPVL
ncbi:MAG: hypothetical protein E6J06_09250 [Chloroflexi bacterium]|nr:MAG: hypothetical protein E6J06_09250 [Chloroflexota bacterium]